MWRRVAGLFRRRRIEQDLLDEMQDHLARETAHRQAQGVAPDEARRQARAAFGGIEKTREELRSRHVLTELDDIVRDLRVALRRILRAPSYALLVIGTIGLAAGGAGTVFSAVDSVLLKPLPYQRPDEVVTVWQTKEANGVFQDDVAVGNYLDWANELRSFSTLVAANPYSVNLKGESTTEVAEAWTVTEHFFELAGTPPLYGRTFRAEDFAAAAPQASESRPPGVAILDHAFWQRRFGGDPSVVGQVVSLDGAAHTIIGVMPPGFTLPEPTDLWLPNAWSEAQRTDRFGTYIKVVGRLAPGVTVAQAEGELNTLMQRLAEQYPRSNAGAGGRIIPLTDFVLGKHRTLLYVLLSAAGLLVVIALANVSALQVARRATREREATIRGALGARRGDVLRPVAVEASVLAVAGAAIGAALALVGVRTLRAFGPPDLPRLNQIGLDWRVAIMLFALAAVSATLITWMGSSGTLRGSLGWTTARTRLGGYGALRARRIAVTAQLALGLVLLSGTALMVRSFMHVLSADRGYATQGIVSFTVWLYDQYPDAARLLPFVDRLTEQLGAVPGVNQVGLGSALPLADGITGEMADIVVPGAGVVEGQEPQARVTVVTPEYFDVLGINRLRGRLINQSDRASTAAVVVINESFARRFFPGTDPVGRTVNVGLMGRATAKEVIGVVRDTRHARLDASPEPAAFLPFAQRPLAAITFVVRSSLGAEQLIRPLAASVYALDPDVGVARMQSMDALVARQLRPRQFLLILLAAFAATAMLVAAVGVYGVLSQSVSERQQEIGLRMALGASTGQVVRTFARESAVMVAMGLVAGVAIAVGVTRVLSTFLYGVAPLDAISFVLASLGIIAVGLLSSVVPTWRASHVQPTTALKE